MNIFIGHLVMSWSWDWLLTGWHVMTEILALLFIYFKFSQKLKSHQPFFFPVSHSLNLVIAEFSSSNAIAKCVRFEIFHRKIQCKSSFFQMVDEINCSILCQFLMLKGSSPTVKLNYFSEQQKYFWTKVMWL